MMKQRKRLIVTYNTFTLTLTWGLNQLQKYRRKNNV